MSKAERTREFIIEKAAPIFNTKGYAGTSIQHLTAATGLTKGSIYGNFENKDEVAVAVYEYNIDQVNKRIIAFMQGRKTALEQLTGLTEYYRENWKSVFKHGGCPLLNASVEADDNLPLLKKPVQGTVKNWLRDISGMIERGQRRGEFKSNISPADYACVILSLLEGGIMLGKIMNSQTYLYTALDRIDDIIYKEIKI